MPFNGLGGEGASSACLKGELDVLQVNTTSLLHKGLKNWDHPSQVSILKPLLVEVPSRDQRLADQVRIAHIFQNLIAIGSASLHHMLLLVVKHKLAASPQARYGNVAKTLQYYPKSITLNPKPLTPKKMCCHTWEAVNLGASL